MVPSDVAAAACGADLQIIAVTDHNRADNTHKLKEAAEAIRKGGQNIYSNNNLLVLPGVEITVEENDKNVHILGIFPEGTDWSQIERVLDDTGLETNKENRTRDSKVYRKRLVKIIEEIHERGGLVILAHVNSNNGYRHEMREQGKSDEDILQNIIALQVDAVEVSKISDIQHFAVGQKKMPCVIGSDAHVISKIGAKEHITRVKMTIPSFTDLSRALKDPRTRIRFEDDSPAGFKRIHGIEFSGGFLAGQSIAFSTNLNCLIGGRGTGKSTLVEAIRYVFDQPIPPERKKDIDNMRDQVFKDCTITILYEDNLGEEYILQRTYGETETKIMNLDGIEQTSINLCQSDRIQVSVFGWSEIERMAKDSLQQLELIDSYIEGVSQLKNSEQIILQKLLAKGSDILNELSSVEVEKGIVGNIKELKGELEKIGEEATQEESHKATAAKESTIAKNTSTTFEELRESTGGLILRSRLEELRDTIEEAQGENELISSDVFSDILTLINDALGASAPVYNAEQSVMNTIEDLGAEINKKLAGLEGKHKEIDKAFAELLERLGQSESARLVQRRQSLRGEIAKREEAQKRLAQSQQKLKALDKEKTELIQELLVVRDELYSLREKNAQYISEQLAKDEDNANADIQLKIEKQKNRTTFIALLNENLKYLPKQWHKRKFPETIAGQLTPLEFATILKENKQDSPQAIGFDADESKIILMHFENKHKEIIELECCECMDLPRIYFSVEGDVKLIEHLSPGQRCTALLPIILLETNTPLIIDQPEDNLDNQFIFDLVVATLRDIKECRQIIVATHNPNIPVSGDAENIIVFQAEGFKGNVEENGSIDNSQIINKVKTIMEGGEEAFLVRVQKYNIQ